MDESLTEQQYYAAIPPRSVGEWLTIKARENIYKDFMRLCRPMRESRILDVGVADIEHNAANTLEQLYPYPDQITAAGTGDGTVFRKLFPNLKYAETAKGQSLPFADKAFDIVTCNAVLEHVGSQAAQKDFVDELCRVGRTVFITVPNRFFPVEHHTAIPLLHYNDRLFSAVCGLLGQEEWGEKKNLILMSRCLLLATAPGKNTQTGYTGLSMGMFSSNLYLLIQEGLK